MKTLLHRTLTGVMKFAHNSSHDHVRDASRNPLLLLFILQFVMMSSHALSLLCSSFLLTNFEDTV